jgi:phosphomannomutase
MEISKEEEDIYNYRLDNFKALKFGTSGLRDLDENLTDIQIYIATRGFLNYLKKIPLSLGGIGEGSRVALAGDFRPSTPRILFSVALAIIDSGFIVDFCGRVPTPTVTLWGLSNNIPSIMITASHNPYGQNGVKFVKPDSEVMKDEEKFILEEINNEREIEYIKPLRDSIFDKKGFIKNYEDTYYSYQRKLLLETRISLSIVNEKAKEFYIGRYKKAFGKVLDGEKFVFYEQTCVGRDIIPEIFRELGASVITSGRVDETREFVPVDTEDMKEKVLIKMAELAMDNDCHVAITTDGDSDRPALLYLRRDENKKIKFKNEKPHYYYLKGDKLNVIACLYLKPHFAIAPISVSHKPMEVLKKHGISVKHTKVGSPHVIKEMKKKMDMNPELVVYGFEANGGGLVGSRKNFSRNNFIEPLTTRDAVFPLICTFILAKERGVNVEELVKEVFSGEHESHTHAGVVENLPNVSVTLGLERYTPDIGKSIIDFFSPIDKNIIEFICDKNLVLDINEEKFEASVENINHLNKIKEILLKYIRAIVGDYNINIEKINYLDGIRIYVNNKEIIHFRPSGNAAQFRVYAESKSEDRVFELVERAIRAKNGVIVRLINDFIDGNLE